MDPNPTPMEMSGDSDTRGVKRKHDGHNADLDEKQPVDVQKAKKSKNQLPAADRKEHDSMREYKEVVLRETKRVMLPELAALITGYVHPREYLPLPLGDFAMLEDGPCPPHEAYEVALSKKVASFQFFRGLMGKETHMWLHICRDNTADAHPGAVMIAIVLLAGSISYRSKICPYCIGTALLGRNEREEKNFPLQHDDKCPALDKDTQLPKLWVPGDPIGNIDAAYIRMPKWRELCVRLSKAHPSIRSVSWCDKMPL